MIVGIIGSGGREHAFVQKLENLQKSVKYFVYLEMLALMILLKI